MQYDKPYKYGTPVLISNWSDRQEAYPVDNPKPNFTGASHYRTFGVSNDIYVPKTSTQEQLEHGLIKCSAKYGGKSTEVNFTSYPMNNLRLAAYGERLHLTIEPPPSTTYREVFKPPKPIIVKPQCCDKPLDPLLNRIPKCDFELLPSSPNMFMDDHLTKISEGRKRINYLRQIRNATYLFKEQTKSFD